MCIRTGKQMGREREVYGRRVGKRVGARDIKMGGPSRLVSWKRAREMEVEVGMTHERE